MYYSLILLIKSINFNISIDYYSLNIFSSLLPHLLQIIERANSYSSILKSPLLVTLNAIDFSHLHMLESIHKRNFLFRENILVLFYRPFHIH